MEPVVSTMQEHPLTLTDILRHGATVYADSVVTTWEGESSRSATFAEVAARADRLAGGAARARRRARATASARSCGTTRSTSRPTSRSRAMGAVLHTLNIRLFPEQLAYVINHAEDKVIIVDASRRCRCWPRSPPS